MGESSEALPYALVSQFVPWLLSHIHRPSFTNNSSSLLISFYLYIFMVASILEPTQIIHILKNPKFTSLNFQVFFRQFSSQQIMYWCQRTCIRKKYLNSDTWGMQWLELFVYWRNIVYIVANGLCNPIPQWMIFGGATMGSTERRGITWYCLRDLFQELGS